MQPSLNVLDRIVADKKLRLADQKRKQPLSYWLEQCQKPLTVQPFESLLLPGQVAIIAEMKRRSPSAGDLSAHYDPPATARLYCDGGARALSVLTEEDHFGGCLDDLRQAQQVVSLPVLRKDFLFDPYQIYEAKAAGASAVLLIMAMLDGGLYRDLLALTRQLKLAALVEVHNAWELDSALKESPEWVGINNRDLKTLTIDLNMTLNLRSNVPAGIKVVSESGIKDAQTIALLRQHKVDAALIGESILRSKNYVQKLQEFTQKHG